MGLRIAEGAAQRTGVIHRPLSAGDATALVWSGELRLVIVAEAIPERRIARAIMHAREHERDRMLGAETVAVCSVGECPEATRLLGAAVLACDATTA
jgi:hypothetical protein